jgi:hypothetical protein
MLPTLFTSCLTMPSYGEVGTAIIAAALSEMFPPDSWSQSIYTGPLNPLAFIAKILVPEVAMRLIMEDMGWDVEQADQRAKCRELMLASSEYGALTFPEDGLEGNDVAALLADMGERAAKRRRVGSPMEEDEEADEGVDEDEDEDEEEEEEKEEE